MPNGRSGSLFLNKVEFGNWLSSRDGQEIIGLSFEPATRRPQAVSVETVVGMLATYPPDRIAVEEQDGRAYVIHIYHPFSLDPPDLKRWILIRPESPLFQELRRQHDQQGKWGAGSL
jgi:hypothetical protein